MAVKVIAFRFDALAGILVSKFIRQFILCLNKNSLKLLNP
jgi:hypothetical protein